MDGWETQNGELLANSTHQGLHLLLLTCLICNAKGQSKKVRLQLTVRGHTDTYNTGVRYISVIKSILPRLLFTW